MENVRSYYPLSLVLFLYLFLFLFLKEITEAPLHCLRSVSVSKVNTKASILLYL